MGLLSLRFTAFSSKLNCQLKLHGRYSRVLSTTHRFWLTQNHNMAVSFHNLHNPEMTRVGRRLNKAKAIQILIARLLAKVVQFLSNFLGSSGVAGEANAERRAKGLVESVQRGP